MILKGGDATMSDLDNQPHLSKEDIRSLLLKVLQDFRAEHKHLPARIVVHKTSNFDSNELNGCHEALDTLDVSSCDLLTVRSSSIRLFRKGQYPPLRGTFLELDAQHSVLYSRGSIDFYQLYPGMYVPRSLAIVRYDAEQSPHQLASEILALTKMNWNNTQFDSAFPITIKAARQVGRILKYASSVQQIQRGYAFYM
jgi:argonaute-like protein implicated in RNA metabolism and viral defense